MVQGSKQFLCKRTPTDAESSGWKKTNEEGYKQWMVPKRWRGNDYSLHRTTQKLQGTHWNYQVSN